MKNPPLGRGHGRYGVVARRSVGSAALEGVEEHVVHGPHVGLDTVKPVGIRLAILGALAVDPLTVGDEFAVKAIQQGWGNP